MLVVEEKIFELLKEMDEEILNYDGNNLFEAGLLDSFVVIDLVTELEDAFDVEIDARYVLEENFRTKDNIVSLMKRLMERGV